MISKKELYEIINYDVLASMIEDICHSISSLSRGREAIKNESK